MRTAIATTLAILLSQAPAMAAAPTCGDPDGGGIDVVDALRTLRTAIGQVECPLFACDADSSGAVVATDALLVLREAVGLVGTIDCPDPALVLRLTSSHTLGAIEIDLDYANAGFDLEGGGAFLSCRALPTGGLAHFNNDPTSHTMRVGFISTGTTGPVNLARCTIFPKELVTTSNVEVTVKVVSSVDFVPLVGVTVEPRL